MDNYQADTCAYRVDAPYPPVRVEGQNCAYAREMLSNMADRISEMSDISRYFYISVVTREQYSWISNCFHHISIVEMHHLNIFADLAQLLGADPRLWCGSPRKSWWSPSYIAYPCSLGAMIDAAIKAEEAAICKYSMQANTICDANIVANLRRILLDEEHHLAIFQEMCRQI